MSANCPLCNQVVKLQYKLISNVYSCSNCGLFVAPAVRFNYDFVSELDEDVRQDALKALRYENFNTIINHIKCNFPHAKKGLEIGSSYGWFLDVARSHNMECIGVEPEKTLFEIARRRGFEVIEGFFPQDFPEELTGFDFIIFNDVLEHIPDVKSTMAKCYDLLNPNGILIVNLPISSGVLYSIANMIYHLGNKSIMNRFWQFNFHSPHYYYFNKKSFKKMADLHNLDIVGYHKLKVIDIDSLDNRIKMDKTSNIIQKMAKWGIKLMMPFLNFLPEDIGCFYAQKKK